jgi:hypothetical protein
MRIIYAKVNGETLLEYPYDFQELKNENPHTKYRINPGDSMDKIIDFYATSADALSNPGNEIVRVVEEDVTIPDGSTCRWAESPSLVDGVWKIEYTLEDLPVDYGGASVFDPSAEDYDPEVHGS